MDPAWTTGQRVKGRANVRFGILGPVVVRSAAGPTPVSGSHVSGMLVSLLLRPNSTVSHAELAGDLWCAPPQSAKDNLRKFAMRLRRQLAAADAELEGRLTTFRGGGYSLRVESGEVDLIRFRTDWEEGRAALAAGRFGAAVAGLQTALALWRGRASIDSSTTGLLATRIEGLNQERLAATEDLAAARIAVMDTVGLVADLTAHLTSWPTRERAAQLLLLALYRSGDVSAALSTYRNTRSYLIRELGVEPGEHLRRIHRAALDRDDATLYDNRLLIGDTHTLSVA
jgi:DNA-binding SARP family transcriptional activator